MTLRAQRLTLRGRHLAYFDAGGDGAPLLALHGHFGRARTFDRLAVALAPEWRVVALEQRGHGRSSPADEYDRAGYDQSEKRRRRFIPAPEARRFRFGFVFPSQSLRRAAGCDTSLSLSPAWRR